MTTQSTQRLVAPTGNAHGVAALASQLRAANTWEDTIGIGRRDLFSVVEDAVRSNPRQSTHWPASTRLAQVTVLGSTYVSACHCTVAGAVPSDVLFDPGDETIGGIVFYDANWAAFRDESQDPIDGFRLHDGVMVRRLAQFVFRLTGPELAPSGRLVSDAGRESLGSPGADQTPAGVLVLHPTTSTSGAHIQAIRGRFGFREQEAVERFLGCNPLIAPLLVEARDELARDFGADAPVRLELFVDPEQPQDPAQLYAIVETAMAPVEALTRMESFNDRWWFARMNETNHCLVFHLEFV